jgi:hypothetical protein
MSPDGMWYWDGRRWIAVSRARARARRAPRQISASALIGLLFLDAIGFPGMWSMTSAVAAAVLLCLDARGLVTLNGLIKWRSMRPWPAILVLMFEVALFQWVVAFYIAQRLYAMAIGGRRQGPVDLSRSAVSEVEAVDGVPSRQTYAPLDADQIQRALNNLLSEARRYLSPDLLEKVRAVEVAIVDLLPAYRSSGIEARDRFVVERTASDYLPSAVHRYLKLPPAVREVPLQDADGKTASQVLADQLDILSRRLREVVDATYREDVEALIVHGRFLNSKFGATSLSLDS